jgi:hypothetical protein
MRPWNAPFVRCSSSAFLAFTLPLGVPASAQSATVSLSLLSQSPWNARYGDPRLKISVVATNLSASSLGHLSVGLSIGPHYETGRRVRVVARGGPDQPRVRDRGSGRWKARAEHGDHVEIPSVDLSTATGIEQTDSQVYPRAWTCDRTVPWWPPSRPPSCTSCSRRSRRCCSRPGSSSADDRVRSRWAAPRHGVPGRPQPPGTARAPIAALNGALGRLGPAGEFPMGVISRAGARGAGAARGQRIHLGGRDGRAEGHDGPLKAAAFLDSLSNATHGPGVRTVATPFAGPTIPSMLASGLGAIWRTNVRSASRRSSR